MNTKPTNFQRTAAWLTACGKEPGNDEHFGVQLGCHIEEFTELLACLTVAATPDVIEEIEHIGGGLVALAEAFKAGLPVRVPEQRRIEFLDALCDGEVTGNGLAFLARMDKEGADAAVLDSNDSKLCEDGRVVLLEGGKIGKGPNYRAPELSAFI